MQAKRPLEPFLKWPGGKRWFVARYAHLFPIQYERYIEPFLGSGAVFFHLHPDKALLSDSNAELIRTYKAVRDSPQLIVRRLHEYQRRHSKRFYYSVRTDSPTSASAEAARFIYLNRVCFNGIYRVNLRGEFNVPMGSKTQVTYDRGYLTKISARLRSAQLRSVDFEVAIAQAGRRDFVFVDPPYSVAHNNNGFIKYNDVIFSWEDQERLAKAIRKAAKRGAYVLVANAYHKSVRELYENLGSCRRLARHSTISGESFGRRTTCEAAFFNYRVNGSV